MKDTFSPEFVLELLKRLPVQVFWKNSDGVYLGCNDAFVQALGLSSQEDIIGNTDFTLSVRIKEAAAYRRDDLEVIRTNRPKLNIEEEQTFPDRRKIFLLTSKVPLSEERNGVSGILGIFSDITDLKMAQEQLKYQKEKAEVASQSKTDFIANMSHDLRTPITGILGMAQDMINAANQARSVLGRGIKGQSSDEALEMLAETVDRDSHLLMSATNKLLRLCNDVLEVARIESRHSGYKTEPFYLDELVENSIELHKPTAQHKKLQLSYDIDPDVPVHLVGSQHYLDRILLNLISNALKFTEHGSVVVSISTSDEGSGEQEAEKRTHIKIQVKDTGIGIPNDKFEAIFENFSRLSASYEGLYQGAGMGLYTVKHYVDEMLGTIDVESELGQGTCFTVILPFLVLDHPEAKKKSDHRLEVVRSSVDEEDGDNESQAADKNQKTSILVVEDNALAEIAVKLVLETFHCKIDSARNGKEAVAMAQEGRYDLILMDIGLPDFSGIEVAKKIRALGDPQKSNVPIVALTGHADSPEIRHEVIDSGMQDVLSKPAQPIMLESVLQKYVYEKKLIRQQQSCNDEVLGSLAVIDWEGCVGMCSGDMEFARKLLSMMNDDLQHTTATLKKAYMMRDIKALREELHRSRGGVCYLKLPQLEYALKSFHKEVRKDLYDIERFESSYAQLMSSIDAFRRLWKKEYESPR